MQKTHLKFHAIRYWVQYVSNVINVPKISYLLQNYRAQENKAYTVPQSGSIPSMREQQLAFQDNRGEREVKDGECRGERR